MQALESFLMMSRSVFGGLCRSSRAGGPWSVKSQDSEQYGCVREFIPIHTRDWVGSMSSRCLGFSVMGVTFVPGSEWTALFLPAGLHNVVSGVSVLFTADWAGVHRLSLVRSKSSLYSHNMLFYTCSERSV